jgi:hypothetical protein
MPAPRGDVKMSAVKVVGFCMLSFLFSTVSTSAATLQLVYMPSASKAVRNIPFNPQTPNSTPMSAPVAVNHYAGLVEHPCRPVFSSTGNKSISFPAGADALGVA